MKTQMPGQLDLLDGLYTHGTKDDRKHLTTARPPTIQLPEEISDWYQEHTNDWWYGDDRCIACGTIADRKGLQITHGVQFDEDGSQHLPVGPGMAENGVCMLMSFTAYHAFVAERLAANDPLYTEFRKGHRCHRHDTPTRKKTCPKSCYPTDADHKAKIATEVWGSNTWRERPWP